MTVNTTIHKTMFSQYKQLYIAMFILFLGCSAGYAVSEADSAQVEQEYKFDVFSYQAREEVNPLMDSAFKNPSKENLRAINNKLEIMEWSWLSRNEGENKELFSEYLDACQLVIKDMQAGNNPDLSEMNRLKNKLI